MQNSNAPLKISLNGLQGDVVFPRQLSNSVEVLDGDKSIIYMGRAFNLWTEGSDIRGNASLARFDREYTLKNKLVGFNFSPFGPAYKSIRVPNDREIWTFYAQEDHPGCKYFVHSGKITRFGCDAHYGQSLVGKATMNGVKLSSQLFDLVFGPIEQRIMEAHREMLRPDLISIEGGKA